MSGIDIINRLEERSSGAWRPSPGSIYPLLAQMEEDGYIETVRVEGRSKTYRLSDKGKDLLTNIRLSKEILIKKMRVGPLFWLGLLEPVDRASAYTDMIAISIERLQSTLPSITSRQRQRVVKKLRRVQSTIDDLIHEIEQGGKNE